MTPSRAKFKSTLNFLLVLYVFNSCCAEENITDGHLTESTEKISPTTTVSPDAIHHKPEEADENDKLEISYLPHDLQMVAEALQKLNSTSPCTLDAVAVLLAIRRKEKWALQMFDASAKFPVGVLNGASYQFGNFDECVNIKERKGIQGKYCMADIDLEERVRQNSKEKYKKKKNRNAFNGTLHWGICIPSSCQPREVQLLTKEIFKLATHHEGFIVTLTDDKCHVEEDVPFTTIEIIFCSSIGTFLSFTILMTIYHYFENRRRRNTLTYSVESTRQKNQQGPFKESLLCFSLLKNGAKFLQVNPSAQNLECICGIKFISMFFIVAGHSVLFMIGGPTLNAHFFDKESTNFANAIFTNSPLLVDTFLLISGFLMCYLLLLELDKRNGRINIAILYISRYIRLTPSYLVVIALYCTILIRTGSGPLWDSKIKLEQQRCLNSWWTNLLYLNNYVNTDSLCMFQSWYLAVDYHLFIIAPFIIYPLWRFNRFGKLLLVTSITASVIVPFWITLVNKLDPTMLSYAPEVQDITKNFYFRNIYIKTHMRASSYLIGLLFGFLLYKLQLKAFRLSKYLIWCGWFVCVIGGVLSLFSICIFYMPSHSYDAVESAIYASLHRVAWCISIGWIIIMCVTDNATVINRLLSWKPFIPLSRLTYCAYLINGFVEILSYGTIRSGIYMSKYELTNKTMAHTVISFGMAFLLCILFESPIHGLEKILLRRKRPSKSTNASDVPEGSSA